MKARIVASVTLLLLTACGAPESTNDSAAAAPARTITGTVTYRERVALPPDAVVEVVLLDVSLQDVAAETVATTTIRPETQVPVPFSLSVAAAAIDERMSYAVRATIRRGDSPLFVTTRSYPVLTQGHPDHADLVLARSGGGEAPVADAELTNTRWMLRTIAGEAVVGAEGQPAPYIRFRIQPSGPVVDGSAGCNAFSAGYSVDGAALRFGSLGSTMRLCEDMSVEDRLLPGLARVRSHRIEAGWLILSGDDGELATFEAFYE